MYTLEQIVKFFSDEKKIRGIFLDFLAQRHNGTIHCDYGTKGIFTANIERATDVERLTHYTHRKVATDFLKHVVLADIKRVGLTTYAAGWLSEDILEGIGNFKIRIRLATMPVQYDKYNRERLGIDTYDEREILYHWLTEKYGIPIVIDNYTPSVSSSVSDPLNKTIYNKFYEIEKEKVKEDDNDTTSISAEPALA